MKDKGVVVMVTPGDERVWFESGSLGEYLKRLEENACEQANTAEDRREALVALAVADALRQLRDGFVLTSLEAAETLRARRP